MKPWLTNSEGESVAYCEKLSQVSSLAVYAGTIGASYVGVNPGENSLDDIEMFYIEDASTK